MSVIPSKFGSRRRIPRITIPSMSSVANPASPSAPNAIFENKKHTTKMVHSQFNCEVQQEISEQVQKRCKKRKRHDDAYDDTMPVMLMDDDDGDHDDDQVSSEKFHQLSDSSQFRMSVLQSKPSISSSNDDNPHHVSLASPAALIGMIFCIAMHRRHLQLCLT